MRRRRRRGHPRPAGRRGRGVRRDDALHGAARWRGVGRVETPLAGAFSVRNCLAAIAAATRSARTRGVREGLRTYRSVRRRMEVRGVVNGITVIDDFAHHPTAVRETLAAARQRYPGRAARGDLRAAQLHGAAARVRGRLRRRVRAPTRSSSPGCSTRSATTSTRHAPGPPGAGWQARARRRPTCRWWTTSSRTWRDGREAGDVIMIMSNGGFGGIHEKLLDALPRDAIDLARLAEVRLEAALELAGELRFADAEHVLLVQLLRPDVHVRGADDGPAPSTTTVFACIMVG
jgi:hypothetical protein